MQTLNVGLHNPVFNNINSVEFTIQETLKYVNGVFNLRVSYDGDEPTLIVYFRDVLRPLERLATALDQDCVALYNHISNEGFLIGDKADQWGEFNEAYFQHINPRELA